MVSLLKCFASKRSLAVIFTLILVPFFSFATEQFSKKNVTLANKKLVVEVAETLAQQEQGLMFRGKLGENDGMLFVFKNEETRFFWMKNTQIDLSIAYFDKNGILFDIQEMKSGAGISDAQLPSYPSSRPAKYALEMNKGWFERNKIKKGSKLKVR
ncbi:MAG: DUF192 domain-containing protein [Bdellovibrio sp.]